MNNNNKNLYNNKIVRPPRGGAGPRRSRSPTEGDEIINIIK